MRKLNFHFIICIALLSYIAGIAMAGIGEPLHNPSDPRSIMTIWDCIKIIFIVISCMSMGYLAGREDYKEE